MDEAIKKTPCISNTNKRHPSVIIKVLILMKFTVRYLFMTIFGRFHDGFMTFSNWFWDGVMTFLIVDFWPGFHTES